MHARDGGGRQPNDRKTLRFVHAKARRQLRETVIRPHRRDAVV
jgi:hypothetical protein